jgi:hypothetical protein
VYHCPLVYIPESQPVESEVNWRDPTTDAERAKAAEVEMARLYAEEEEEAAS